MPEKFEIKLDKKEVKNTIEDIEKSDYYKRIADQVKKIRSGETNQAFKGNADKWRDLFHNFALDDHDNIIMSVMHEDYLGYQAYIDPIKKLIGFHKLNLKKTLDKVDINSDKK